MHSIILSSMLDLGYKGGLIFVLHSVLKARCRVVAVDRFYIALVSALEQTHCARM